jgi:hypothetical protein
MVESLSGFGYAISLLSSMGGAADYNVGHRLLTDVLKDEHAPDNLKGLSAAALGDRPHLGRGEDVNIELAKAQYEIAFEFGMRDAARRRSPTPARCIGTYAVAPAVRSGWRGSRL